MFWNQNHINNVYLKLKYSFHKTLNVDYYITIDFVSINIDLNITSH